MKDFKKTWSKPHLIVLGRGTPDETVLAACKINGADPGVTTHTCSSILCQATGAS